MSRFGLSTQMLSRCGTTWLRASPVVVPMGTFMALPVCHSARHVSTTRPKKAQAMKVTLKETAAVPIEKKPPAKTRKASTKATAAAVDSVVKPAKKAEAAKTRVTKAKAPSSVVTELKPKATATKTAAVKATPVPAPATAKVASPLPSSAKIIATASASAKTPAIAANTPASSRLQRVTPTLASAPAAQSPPPPRPLPTPAPPSKPIPNAGNTSKGKADTSSPEYKQAALKWTKAIIALPILIVTSYVLYDRLVLGNERSLEDIRSTIRGDSSETEAVASDDAAQTSNTA